MTDTISSQSQFNHGGKKDDLVERVMESIKVLNKKEEETKKEKDLIKNS